jgi:hypothetical protein
VPVIIVGPSSTVDAFDDPQVALRSVAQSGECRLIRRTIVCGDSLSQAIKFNHYGAFFDAVLVRFGGDTAREEAPASSEDSRCTELAVVLSCCGVPNGSNAGPASSYRSRRPLWLL